MTTHGIAAPTIATRIPGHRTVPGLEYGTSHNGRRFVRPTGMTLWGLARELPGEDLPDDATILDELTAELDRWDHLPEAFHPAVAVLLEDGGIRAASEVEEYRAVLPAWAWARFAERLVEYGARPEGILAGRHVRAALAACHRDPGADQALEGIGRRIIEAVEVLDALGEELSGQTTQEKQQGLTRAAELLGQARQKLDQFPLSPEAALLGVCGRLDMGVTFLGEINGALGELGEEAAIAGLAAVKRLVEPTWVNLGRLELARIGEAESAQAVSA
jgi:hypothetical protein